MTQPQTIACPNCRTSNWASEANCYRCGAALRVYQQQQPSSTGQGFGIGLGIIGAFIAANVLLVVVVVVVVLVGCVGCCVVGSILSAASGTAG